MNILITGGSGFIGSHFVDTFIERGHRVTVYDRTAQVHEHRAAFIHGDLKDRQSVEEVVRRHDFVIHAGGVLGTHETVAAPAATAQENIIGGLNILDAVTRYGNRLINISKPNVWLNPYSITKDCVEKFCFMYVREFGTKLAIIKPFNVYGPRQKYSRVQKAIPTWIVQALTARPLEIFGSGRATMDLVHVKDICDGTAAVLEQFDACRINDSDEVAVDVWGNFPAYNHQVLEIGSGEEIRVQDAIVLLQAALGIEVDIKHLPMRRGEIDGTRLRADNSRLMRLTGYRPKVDLGDGLRETVAYYRANLDRISRGEL